MSRLFSIFWKCISDSYSRIPIFHMSCLDFDVIIPFCKLHMWYVLQIKRVKMEHLIVSDEQIQNDSLVYLRLPV